MAVPGVASRRNTDPPPLDGVKVPGWVVALGSGEGGPLEVTLADGTLLTFRDGVEFCEWLLVPVAIGCQGCGGKGYTMEDPTGQGMVAVRCAECGGHGKVPLPRHLLGADDVVVR